MAISGLAGIGEDEKEAKDDIAATAGATREIGNGSAGGHEQAQDLGTGFPHVRE
ncbi:MAG: hypothetical protein RBT51_12515 [Ectothiorhodospiraceae bacterium]|nr:hypothetical protein [Ectothiorhodospiraceae bacterium]